MSDVHGDDSERWVRCPRLLWRSLLEMVVVLPLDVEGSHPLVVSGSAGMLWRLLGAPTTFAEIVNELAACYATTREVIAADLVPTLASLEVAGVLQRVP